MGSDGCVFRTPCFYVVTRNSQVSQQRRDPGTPCFYVVTQIPRSRNSGETWGTLCFYSGKSTAGSNQQADERELQLLVACLGFGEPASAEFFFGDTGEIRFDVENGSAIEHIDATDVENGAFAAE